MYLVDPLAVKTLEKKYGIFLTEAEIDQARHDDGHLSIRSQNKYYHIRLPLFKFPFDLLSEQHLEIKEFFQATKKHK